MIERHSMTRHKGTVSLAVVFLGLVGVSASRLILPDFMPVLFMVLQTGFEAGTVGGAADWLAVKMIFDEIRIGKWKIVPASGIIPRKQLAIAQGAGKLVATEWLTPASVQKMLRNLDAAEFLAGTIESWHRSGESKKATAWLMDRVGEWLDRPDTKDRLAVLSRNFLQQLRISQWLGYHGSEDRIQGILQTLIPYVCDKVADLLTTKDAFDLIHSKLSEEQDSFFKKILFDPVEATEKTILKATLLVREIQHDDDHPLRRKLIAGAASWIQRLAEDGPEARDFDAMAAGVVESIPVEQWVQRVIRQVRDYFETQKQKDDGPLQTMLGSWIDEAIVRLRSDRAWKDAINTKIVEAAGDLMASHHHKIAELVEENLRSLSPEQIKEQFRSRTYDDMQWIRVNGAVAGFAIGLLIGLARWLGGW